MENYLDILDNGFNRDSIGIKLKINESTHNNQTEIFKHVWFDKITEIFVLYINKYSENLILHIFSENTLKNCNTF